MSFLLFLRRKGNILGCAFRFVFRFLTGLIFLNPRNSADYFRFRGTHARIKPFQGKINLFRNPTESRILAGIKEGRTLKGATCNKYTAGRLKNHNKSRCQQWHSAATAPRRKPLRCATVLPCCCHYCHCLSRGSSNGAGMAVCGGGSSSNSGSVGDNTKGPKPTPARTAVKVRFAADVEAHAGPTAEPTKQD